jgi:hypothetical protein
MNLSDKLQSLTLQELAVYQCIANSLVTDKVTNQYIKQAIGYDPKQIVDSLLNQKVIYRKNNSLSIW